MATLTPSLLPKTLSHSSSRQSLKPLAPNQPAVFTLPFSSCCFVGRAWVGPLSARRLPTRRGLIRATVDGGDFSSKRGGEEKETIMLPGCDYKHWLIVMEFPKDPAPTREQMIATYLETLATVLGSMEEAKKKMYAFSTTTYTGFQCEVDEETSEKFKGLPGVLWVLPDSYIDVKNKDYGGDKYINGEIIPCKYPTYQPKQKNNKYESRRYVRRKDGSSGSRPPRQQPASSESASA